MSRSGAAGRGLRWRRLPRPTKLGSKAAAFYAVLTAAFFAAPYSNLFFLLVTFLSVLAVLSVFWAFRVLAGVSGEIRDPGPVPAGTPIELSVSVAAKGRTRPAVRLLVDFGDGPPVQAAEMDVEGPEEIRAMIPPRPRGIYRVRGAWLATDAPLGFLLVKTPVAILPELVVHPAPAEELPGRGTGAGAGGEDLLRAIGRGTGFLQPSELREYRPGDEMGRVHFKASARRGKLIVTEWDGGGGGEGIEIVLDRRAEAGEFEAALSELVSLALLAAERKESLKLTTQDLVATFGERHRPRDELLRFLAGVGRLPPGGPPPPPASLETLRLPRRSVNG